MTVVARARRRQPAATAVEGEVHHVPGVFLHELDLLDVVVLVEDAVLQRVDLLGHALGIEEAEVVVEVGDEVVFSLRYGALLAAMDSEYLEKRLVGAAAP